MSTADRLRAEGRIEGRVQGRIDGKLGLLLRQLELRLGPLPEAARARLQACAEPGLDAIAGRLLDARSLAEALADRAPAVADRREFP